MDADKLIQSLNKTGFILEYEVARLFEKNGWSVLNNRYYLDDVNRVSREIDIIAYKAREVEGILFYTTLIISCKKCNENYWTFMIRDLNKKDPNIDLYPINDWSNNRILNFMKGRKDFERNITEEITKNENVKFTYGIDDEVFAFQKVSKKNYKLKNDKAIYDSIITAIKALEYEKSALNNRVTKDALYNFNIVSVFDGDMCSIKYDEEEPRVNEVDHIKYLNRHIVNETESFYRVHFIKYNKLKDYLKYFDGIHDWHWNIYSNLKNKYRELIVEERDESALKLLLEEFKNDVWLYSINQQKIVEIKSLSFDSESKLRINCGMEGVEYEVMEGIVEKFNADQEKIEDVKRSLKKVYGYNDDFYFYNDLLPF